MRDLDLATIYAARGLPPAVFREWWPLMDPILVLTLIAYQEALWTPFCISPAQGALGRRLGAGSGSQHNVDRWRQVRAADIMFPEEHDQRAVFDFTRDFRGFSGIGVYPDWEPHWGLHVDVRRDRTPVSPALWGHTRAIGYTTASEALSAAKNAA